MRRVRVLDCEGSSSGVCSSSARYQVCWRSGLKRLMCARHAIDVRMDRPGEVVVTRLIGAPV